MIQPVIPGRTMPSRPPVPSIPTIIINSLFIIVVSTQKHVYPHSPFQSHTKFVNLTASRPSPSTLLVTWEQPKCEQETNISVQYRRRGQIDWAIVFIDTADHPNSYRLNWANACSTYEIRLGIVCKETRKVNSYYSETVMADLSPIPNRLDPIKPVIIRNIYNTRTDSVDVEFTLENRTDSIWPMDSRYVSAEVHVVECGDSGENGDGNLGTPVPPIRWITGTTGIIQFPKQYISIAQSGHVCQVMIFVTEYASICGRRIKFDGQMLDNAVFVDLSCDSTQYLQCSSIDARKRKKMTSPKCDPEYVQASQVTTTTKNVQLQVKWDFDKNASALDTPKPDKIILRYGYTDVPSSADPLLAVLVPMREIERFRVDPTVNSTTIYTNTSAEPNLDSSAAHRSHRISICAVFGNDTEEEERKINWAIIPTFPVNTIQPNNSKMAEKECKCDKFSSIPPSTTTANRMDRGGSTTTMPSVISSPAYQGFETFWEKVAPMLAVFLIMTLINIILLMAACYYYKKARWLNGMK